MFSKNFKLIFPRIIYYRYIILPNDSAQTSQKNLHNLGIKTVTNSSKTVRSMINDKNNNIHIKSEAGFYTMPGL